MSLTNKAAWLRAPKAVPLEVGPAPMPTAEGTEIVIEVRAVAINPVDPAIQFIGILLDPSDYPFILGFDMAGIVLSVGPNHTHYKPGDRVTSIALALLHKKARFGAFQHYAVADGPLMAKIPDSISFNEASVLGLGLATASYSLFSKDALALDLPKPGGNKPNGKLLLVWGGASSVGVCGIQIAKAAGYTIAATASARNFALLREIGAEYVFDYSSESVVEDIVAALKGKGEMAGVFSAIVAPSVLLQCAAISGKLGGRKHVGTVLAPGMPMPGDWPKDIEYSISLPALIATNEVGQAVGAWLEGALADGSMKCRPNFEVVGKGLEEIQGAFGVLSKGVSAKKLVVELP
ncbi:chaperonin 10-like protein [Favolaschia claudopus]|uniref:Chaperonin 10-like protein n=1 Tax=Favolaschia claudopus TaxID=2862362 RepID=A0AAW0CCG7_9AGAR